MSPLHFLALPALLVGLFVNSATAQSTAPLRDLNTHCPFTPPKSLEAWQSRAADLQLQLKTSLGQFPAIELDPVEPSIYGKIERDGYTIEKVTFESLPGFYVTGNLYRPAQLAADARIPAVLCPHGHWTDARFYEASPRQVKQLLASGAERFENAARNHIQARCVQLARMGCIVFHWDMIGYCDNTQISFARAHRFAQQPKEEEVTDAGWLLFSPLAESHCQSILGLQSLATSRAIDMLLTLPEVDPQRIAITGASGGGTQSFIGAALDARISVAFPAVMVSTGMQGGCTCENACLLRTGTGNVELAAVIAPRPLGLTAADDWTKTMPQDGYPELQKLYSLYDAKQNVALFPAIHFGHNFNHISRVAMYGWMNEHLGLGLETPILERDFELALGPELSVWDDAHPQPEGGEVFERKLMKLWAELIDSHMSGMLAGDRQQLSALSEILSAGWRVCLGLTTTQFGQVQAEGDLRNLQRIELHAAPLPAWRLLTKIPNATTSGEQSSSASDESHQTVMESWTATPQDLRIELSSAEGKNTTLYPILAGQQISGNADSGFTARQTKLQSIVENPRLAAAYTFGYNLPLFAQRAQQLGLTIQWLAREYPNQSISIHGQGADAALAAAGVFVGQQLARESGEPAAKVALMLQPGEFEFAKVDSIRAPSFLPGAARYWDLPGLIASLQADVEITTSQAADYRPLKSLVSLAGGSLTIQ